MRGGGSGASSVQGRSRLGAAGHEGGAHLKHLAHVCDAGRVKAQRLVERTHTLPCPRGSMGGGDMWAGLGGARGAAAAAQAACRGRSRLETGAGGARAERTENMYCMSVTLDVSQLSGWLNALAYCRVQGEACREGGMRAGLGGVAGRRQRRKQRAGEVQTGDGGGRGTGGAHLEHVEHVCDAGRVKAQRLVERTRTLPSPRGSVQSGQHVGWAGRGRGAAAAQAACRRGPGWRRGAGHGRSAPGTCCTCL